MKLDKYIVIEGRKDRFGYMSLKARMVERTPKLKGNEVGLRLDIDIPSALFERPTLEAKMVVPDTAVQQVEITPEVTDNIEKIIKESTGLVMAIKIVPFETEVANEDDEFLPESV